MTHCTDGGHVALIGVRSTCNREKYTMVYHRLLKTMKSSRGPATANWTADHQVARSSPGQTSTHVSILIFTHPFIISDSMVLNALIAKQANISISFQPYITSTGNIHWVMYTGWALLRLQAIYPYVISRALGQSQLIQCQ